MGFGMLLIGYFLTNIMPVISIFSAAMLPGYLLIAMALYRLVPYHKRFYQAMWLSFPAFLFALYYTLYSFVSVGLLPQLDFLGGMFFAVVEWLYFFYQFLHGGMVLWGIADLMAELGLQEMQSNAWRNLTFLAIYELIYFILKLPIPFLQENISLFVLPITLLRYLCIFLNLWLFFRCYRNILPEGSDQAVPELQKKGRKT